MINQEKKGKTEAKRVVLAYGEVTGHAHAFYGEDTVVLEGHQLVINKTDQLQHEEHTSHTLNPGVGEVTIQREYQLGKIIKVVD